MRVYEIFIDKNRDWEIRLKEVSNYHKFKSYNFDIFGITKVKNKKFIYIYDIYIDDKIILKAKKNQLFFQKALFIDINTRKRFKGTFIDALKYINKHFYGQTNSTATL